jgi:DNA-3-methyladenine glycosylase I
MGATNTTVCPWASARPLLRAYHDAEWGVPEREGRALWEKLVPDGFQAGLSWLTVLKKRDALREAFAGFEPETVARFRKADVNRLLKNDDPAGSDRGAAIDRHLSRAERRLQVSLKSLAVLRRLRRPPVVTRVNIAQGPALVSNGPSPHRGCPQS